VSTDKDDQINSLEGQKSFFIDYINKNPEWQFSGLYVDEGLSGTSVEKRIGFQNMIEDAKGGKIDLILTKEVSRFARNTVDSVQYSRELKSLGVGILFLSDNIFTLDGDSELRLTLMSSLAQEESRKISERVKWGNKQRFKAGVVYGSRVFGYHLKGGKLTVNEEEAEIVRLIFRLYNEGMGTHVLSKELQNRGIVNPSGKKEWSQKSLLNILKNEKYCGVLKSQKSITVDHLSHRRVKNDGVKKEFVVKENNHEPIISSELFIQTQNEIKARRNGASDNSVYLNRYAWSGKLVCSKCGSHYVRKIWNAKKEFERIVWQCGEKRHNGLEHENDMGDKIGCNSAAVFDDVMREAALSALKSVVKNKKKIVNEVMEIVRKTLSEKTDNNDIVKRLEGKIKKTETEMSELVDLFLDKAITRKIFDEKNHGLVSEANRLNEELERIRKEESDKEDLQSRLDSIGKAVDSITDFDEYSEEVMRRVLKKVVVHDREKLDIYFAGDGEKPCFIPLVSMQGLPRRARSN